MTNYKFRAIVAVKASLKNAANTFWKNNIDPDGGENTFTVGLSPTGSAPAAWYWCNTVLTLAQMKKVVEVADNNSTAVRIVIWARDIDFKPRLEAEAASRDYITIANDKHSPQDALDHFGMQVIEGEE